MNKRQKLVQQQFLNNEEAVIKRLRSVYDQSLKDIEEKAQSLQDDINRLGTLAKLATDEDEKAQILSMQQAKVYQKQYQDALKKQVGFDLWGRTADGRWIVRFTSSWSTTDADVDELERALPDRNEL